MKCEICGAEAQLIKGRELCDEHKVLIDILDVILDNRKFLDAIKLSRMPWMEEK